MGLVDRQRTKVTEAVCVPCTRERRKTDPLAPEVICPAKDLPFVFRLLTVELAAMGINLKLSLRDQVEDAYHRSEEYDQKTGRRMLMGLEDVGGSRGKPLITVPHTMGEEDLDLYDKLD